MRGGEIRDGRRKGSATDDGTGNILRAARPYGTHPGTKMYTRLVHSSQASSLEYFFGPVFPDWLFDIAWRRR